MTSKAPACRRGKESKAMNQGKMARGVDTTPFKPNYISKNDTTQNPQEDALHKGDLGVPVRCCYSAESASIQRAERQEQNKPPYLSLHWSQPCDSQGSKKELSVPGEHYFPKPHFLQLTLSYQQLGWRLNYRSMQHPRRTGSPFHCSYLRLHTRLPGEG